MKYRLVITHMHPGPNGDEISTFSKDYDSMLQALEVIEQNELNFTVFINVSITPVRVLNSKEYPNG